ncbi:polyprenyl synthetase family protein [Streptomyces sp. NPDC102359]|uniref:polyprenyl synthetase family protein n=1 Tax=Streptomyces sp. NPDC102359 TaxID=3366159 RepID=UPI0037F8E6CA
MRELRSATEEPAERAGGPLTADAATRAVVRILGEVLDARMSEAYDVDAVFAREVAGRVSAFARRGGKRLRTAFAWCGWRAGGGSGDPVPLLRTGAALELVQTCALVHDDVMDGSHLRRGAPAVHVDLARLHRAEGMAGSAETFGHSAAVLAGDLALAWADDLMTDIVLDSPHGPRVYREWRAMRGEMVAGQYRDLQAQAAGASGVDEALTIATLKSALYTVERPLALGASLAGADEPVMTALRAAGRCTGLAFQLRDDLLGAFGDPAQTGKPVGDDLRARKLTYLLAVALELGRANGDEEAVALLSPGSATLPDRAVEGVRAALERTGARDEVEAKIAELADSALRHFDETGAPSAVRREFAALVARASGITTGCVREAV